MDTVPLFKVYAEDYFITNQLGLPWSQIPDFVVGRNGYDNWLVAKTIDWNLTVIDASRTLLALHQSGSDGHMSGSRTVSRSSRLWNIELAKGFRFNRGITSNAPFYTTGKCKERPIVVKSIQCNEVYNITLNRRSGIRRKRVQSALHRRSRIRRKRVQSAPKVNVSTRSV